MGSLARARHAAYAYPQHGYGLSPVALDVAAGEALHVAGPSGSGKSTLARCLSGLIPHLYRGELQGRVWVGGLRTTDVPLWRLTERAGLVFQNPSAQMLAATAEDEIIFGLENLGMSRKAIDRRLAAALDRFGLGPLRHRSPHTLSGGEQQKLALAAITARRPPLLILDEPLSMLDPTASMDLIAHLEDLTEAGTAVVICEHRARYLGPLTGLHTLRLDGTTPRPSGSPSQAPPPSRPGFDVPSFRLQVSHLTVRLGGRPVLRDVSFSAKSGQVLALVGRNGVGKTTLLRALAGLQRYAGEITVDGRTPDFGMVFQNPELQLFNPTVREEVLYRLEDPSLDRYHWLLAMLGLIRYEETPPLLLSEGEKKRLALATTVMHDPRHGILLDEPALGQDAVHKEILVGLTRALADAGQLVIVTTHDLTLASQADRLLLLGENGLAADGPPGELLATEGPWRQVGLRVPDWVVAP